MTISAILFDLDGVVRHFDPKAVRDIEHRHGLASGTIEKFAFSSPLIEHVTTGVISRAEWVDHIAKRIENADAADEWSRQPYRVDAGVIELADQLRAAGLVTAILTNGTDIIDAEAQGMRLHDHFDAVFNSAEIGHAKPDPHAYRAVLDALGVTVDEIFFTDDSESKLAGAEALGITSHLFTGIEGLRESLRSSGVLIPPADSTRTEARGLRLDRRA